MIAKQTIPIAGAFIFHPEHGHFHFPFATYGLYSVGADGGPGVARDIPIRAGEIFLLPPRTPHSPQRFADSIGLVIERKRLPHEDDGLMWFCERCNHKLYEEFFHLHDIETDFPPVFERFYASPARRTCAQCGHVNPAPTKYVMPDT